MAWLTSEIDPVCRFSASVLRARAFYIATDATTPPLFRHTNCPRTPKITLTGTFSRTPRRIFAYALWIGTHTSSSPCERPANFRPTSAPGRTRPSPQYAWQAPVVSTPVRPKATQCSRQSHCPNPSPQRPRRARLDHCFEPLVADVGVIAMHGELAYFF
eukprot:4451666-Amphidinium_carterae.1